MALTKVQTGGLANDAVTSTKVADDAITSALIADDAIISAAIADNAVDNARISGLAASKLSGALPSIDGSALTGLSGSTPAFCATRNGDQTSNINTVTKVDFNSELYDSNGKFANARFTPTVAGFYYIYTQVNNNNLYNQAALNVFIRRNGTNVAQGHVAGNNSTSNRDYTINCAILIGCGTSDYFEVFASQELGNGQMIASVRSMFLGFKVG